MIAALDHQAKQTTQSEKKRVQEQQGLQKALSALAREAQRWDDAYAHGVIDVTELKAKKDDIANRKHSLLAQQEALAATRYAADQVRVRHTDIRRYCQQVKARLQTLTMAKKREGLEALDIHVFWTPGAPIRITGSIPLDFPMSTVRKTTGRNAPRSPTSACASPVHPGPAARQSRYPYAQGRLFQGADSLTGT
jgi:hypothetical protein